MKNKDFYQTMIDDFLMILMIIQMINCLVGDF